MFKSVAPLCCTLAVLSICTGCEKQAAPPGGVKVDVPGVKVNVDPNKGVEVKTPGASVSVPKP